jgi:micrococcal nuclease
MRRLAVSLVAVALALCGAAWADERAMVVRAVDGDTLEVRMLDGSDRSERVRLIGVQASELRTHEAWSVEAQQHLRFLAAGETVRLVADTTSSDRDRYGRLLRYVVLRDGRDVNAELIRSGSGHAYLRFPFDKMGEYRKLQGEACRAKAGGWGAGAGWGECPAPAVVAAPAIGGDPTIYVTRSGEKYHASGCGSLRGGGTPMRLSQALARGLTPCGACSPPGPR